VSLTEISMAMTAALEQAVNTYLRLDPEGSTKLGRFSGKVIALQVEGTPLTIYMLPGTDGLQLMTRYAGPVDTTLSGRPLALMKLGIGDSSRVLMEGEVSISGDVETGQSFKRVLDNLHIDWEEPLARLTGDVFAHKAGHLLREIGTWLGNARGHLAANGAEYLQQEIEVLPTRAEVEAFYQGVEGLRDDVARLAAKLELLSKRL
jgi:ubiquinone biosynthesis accessory factor UbiJ